jgi:hypothetical protein
MQGQNSAGTERGRQEMIALLNSGDKRELRAFMQLYSKRIYDRAFDITHDPAKAKDATRRVLAEVASLAARGELKENIDAQLMALTDQVCSEALFFNSLVDEALKAEAAPKASDMAAQEAPAAAEPREQQADVLWTAWENAPAEETILEPGAEAADMEMSDTETPGMDLPGVEPDEAEELDAEVPNLFDDDADTPPTNRRRREKPAKRYAPAQEEDEDETTSPLLVIAIILLSMLVVFLVWILIVKLMASGVLPNFDFGFADWFNTHIFKLY